jgi:hypothetical protein
MKDSLPASVDQHFTKFSVFGKDTFNHEAPILA